MYPPGFLMSLKVGTRKRTNPSIPHLLLGFLEFSSFCLGQPIFLLHPNKQPSGHFLFTTRCKMQNAVIYNLRSNPPTNNRQNIMLPLTPPNTHPCREGNTPSLPEVPPKLHLCCLFWSLGSSLGKPLHEIMQSLQKCTCWHGYQQLSQGTQRPAR